MIPDPTSPDRSGGGSPTIGRARVGLFALTPALALIWLFIAALPVLADGGPHIRSVNDGSLGINADSCAGCHRAHTAQGPMLINAADEEALCLTCHGSGGVGSTVDVLTGVQYKIALAPGSTPQDPSNPSVILGALRSGGFDKARLDAGNVARRRYGTGIADFYAKVPVGAPEDVTSAHVGIPGVNDLTMPGIAWGNGSQWTQADPAAPYAGPDVAPLTCASCHNPHGNGQYRILNPIPAADGAGFVADTADNVVTDSPVVNPDPGDTSSVKNYTVIQKLGTGTTTTTYALYAEDVTDLGYGPATGDYLHRYVPWNPGSVATRMLDAPNGRPATFNTQMTNWCIACHQRYYSVDPTVERADPNTGEPDLVYRYQHQTATAGTVCTTCHVAHGTNATMAGYAGSAAYPDGTVPAVGSPVDNGNSRLLKIDNRGTCQACHDPTKTVLVNGYTGPVPTPGIP